MTRQPVPDEISELCREKKLAAQIELMKAEAFVLGVLTATKTILRLEGDWTNSPDFRELIKQDPPPTK